MNAKERLYAVIGGCVGAVLTMAVCSLLPLGAQSQGEDVFDEITCTKLTVINAENNEIITLGSNPKFGHALVRLCDSDGSVLEGLILAAGNGGSISSLSQRGLFNIGYDEHGASITLFGERDGGEYVELGIGEHGGRVRVGGPARDGSHARMGVSEHGGEVAVFGNGSSKGQAVMGINEYGNGAVSTWDKNGYRIGTLK